MRRGVVARVVLLATVAVVSGGSMLAGNVGEGDREIALGLGFADLDLGSVSTVDRGSADGLQGSASISWYQSRILNLGARLSLLDLESDEGETIDGSTYGIVLGLHRPTRGAAHPFVSIGFGLTDGNLGRRYGYALEAGAGVKIYPSDRWGLGLAARYRSLDGKDFVPDGSMFSVDLELLFKF